MVLLTSTSALLTLIALIASIALLPTSVHLEARVRAWAEAWSSQDLSAYLGSYAAAYQPPGTSRQQWEAQRTQRLLAPEFIEITIGSFEPREEAQ